LKKYFYAVRPLLCCRWILDQKTPPPLEFSKLVATHLDADLIPTIDRLLDMKMNAPELAEIKRINALNDFIETELETTEKSVRLLPKRESRDWEQLNAIFLEAINQT
jgi:predicted nucleotidyltransferase